MQLTPTEQSRLAAAPQRESRGARRLSQGPVLLQPSERREPEEGDRAVRGSGQVESELRAGVSRGCQTPTSGPATTKGFLTATEARPKAKAAAEKAVQLDDNSAEAHTSLAVFKLFYEYDWAGCEREFRRAFALNPNYAFAHDQFGLALAFQGRLDEAIAEGKRAAELDPLSPQIPIDNSIALMFQGRLRGGEGAGEEGGGARSDLFLPADDLRVG